MYNKMLLDAFHIAFVVIMMTLQLFIVVGGDKINISKENENIDKAKTYVIIFLAEFGVPIMLQVIFTMLLHMSNPESGKYVIKQCRRQ